MRQSNTIRLSGSKRFVKEGDMVVDIFRDKGYGLIDGELRDSSNPKYKGNFVRYIRLLWAMG